MSTTPAAFASNVVPLPVAGPRFTFHEFFAGGGMARAGLGQHWQCLIANDISAQKAASYARNWGDDHLKVADIFDLSATDLPGTPDLSWGSFPCQDLSLAGAGAGLDGDSSGAFWGYWRLVQQLRRAGRAPRMVVLENVYGALTSHEGKDFQQIIEALVEGGYRVGAMVVDAVHFVPQSRPRVFFVGVAEDLVIPDGLMMAMPNPAWHPATLITAHNQLPKKLRASWIWWNLPCPQTPAKTLDEIIEDNPVGVKWHTDAETRSLLSMMTEVNMQKVRDAQKSGVRQVGGIYKRTREGVQRAEVRFDGVLGCLRTPSGGSSRQIVMIVEGPSVRSRLLSPREAARLMGLPDHYILPAKYNEAYHLAGDGVAVPVVAHLARNIFEPLLEGRQLQKAEVAA